MNNLTGLPDKLGAARLIGNYENGTDAWHELRATGIGGSDIAAICKVSKWTSPFTLWAKKTGRIDDNYTPSEAAEWGNRLEAVVLDKFEEEHPEYVLHRNPGTWANEERPWQLANPDAIYEYYQEDPALNEDQETRGYGIVEVKTSRYEDDWTDGVPVYYATQVQWYLQTFGLTEAYVVVLFAGSKYREYRITANEFEQGANLAEVEKFRKYLNEDKQPDFDGALNTYETVRQLNPDVIDDEEELGDLGMHYELAVADAAAAEAHLTEMKTRVLDAMGNKKRGLINGVWKVTRQARNGGAAYLVNKKG